MNTGFSIHRFRFCLETKAPLFLPAYNKGNVIRGGFGSAFRRIVCHAHCRDAETCELRSVCPYTAVFQPFVPEGSEKISRNRDIPRPFVIKPSLALAGAHTLRFDARRSSRAVSWLATWRSIPGNSRRCSGATRAASRALEKDRIVVRLIVFAFRKPKFPLICDLDGDLFAAHSPAALHRQLAGVELADEKKARFVDASGEGWTFLAEERIFAPRFSIRRWRKIEVIRMFNNSRSAKNLELQYPERRLVNRRLDMIVGDIAALLSQPGKTQKKR